MALTNLQTFYARLKGTPYVEAMSVCLSVYDIVYASSPLHSFS
jgi:hypothetical protein